MGTDKGSLILESRTLLEHAVGRVAPLFFEVIVAVNEPPTTPIRFARFVKDAASNVGPLMGLYSALLASSAPRALVIAPDMPFQPTGLLAALARASRRHDIVAARCCGRVQPLCAVYSKSILPLIEDCLSRGERSLRSLYEQSSLRVFYLGDSVLRRWGDPRVVFWNINTPDDFEEAKRLSLEARSGTAYGPRCRAEEGFRDFSMRV